MEFSDEEHVLGVIPNASGGMLGKKMYNIVVTDRRLVMASLTSSMIKDEVKRVTRQSKEQGVGRLKRMAITMAAGANLYRRYFSMPVADILSETSGNFTVEPGQIKSVKIKTNLSNDGTGYEILIKWTGGKLALHFSDISPKDAKSLLVQTLGNIVK